MKIIPVPFASLSQTEQAQFNNWLSDIRAVGNKSKRKRLASSPPELLVFDNGAPLGSHHASTTGNHFRITRDLLPVAVDLRRYFVAHELGHIEGFHPLITSFSGIAFTLSFATGLILLNAQRSGSSHPFLSAICLSLCIASLAVLLIYNYTMWFEWDADRRGARMIGARAMTTGINLLMPIRGPALRTYYSKKKRRLAGLQASHWITRP